MPDAPGSARDISAILNERRKTRDAEIAVMNHVQDAIENGVFPPEYAALFSPTDIQFQLQTIASADNNITTVLSEIPILPHVDVQGKRDTDKARNASETAEKIAFSWYNGAAMRGGPEFDSLTHQLATFQTRFSDACLVAHPDYDRKLVYLEAKDPRSHFPPVGWHPGSLLPLDGTIIVTEQTLGVLKRTFGYDADGMATDVLRALNNAYARKSAYGMDAHVDDSQVIQIAIYRSRDAWFVVALGDPEVVLVESHPGDRDKQGRPTHPGVTGVVSFKQFMRGPIFTGQIGLEAGLTKVLNQQLQNTERINKAPIIGPPLLGDTLRWGEYNVIDLSMLQGRVMQPQRMAPDSPSNLTQVMGQLLQLAQLFNYNPESMMGAGDANSGKAIQQLQAGPRALVTNIMWSPYKPAFARIHDDCLDMELNLWPNERKTVRGRNGKTSFEIDYTPSAALQGFKGHIKIEDARLGGYNAFLEALQKHEAGMIDLDTVLERDPDIRDVKATKRRIEKEQTEKFANAAFEALASQDPLLAIRAANEVMKRIDTGKSRSQAIQEVIDEGLLEPPAPPEAEMAQAGGIPPELAAMMGGADIAGALPPPGVI